MPKGITKDKFKEVSKYYDNEIFIGAGRRIRNIAKHADTLPPIERAKTISDIFSTFRNPDKETVLTPWRTVNMHMGDTLGGWNFYDNKYIVTIEEPRFINNGDATRDVLLNKDSKILEFNSKTGLYPLYVTISLFKHKCLNVDSKKLTEELMEQIWEQTIEDNIFIVCKTPMAKTITKRTLIGYKDKKTTRPTYTCDSGFVLENNFCVRTEIVKPKKEITCPNGYTKVDFDRCINMNNIKEFENGFVCNMENSRLQGNDCIIYDVIEIKN